VKDSAHLILTEIIAVSCLKLLLLVFVFHRTTLAVPILDIMSVLLLLLLVPVLDVELIVLEILPVLEVMDALIVLQTLDLGVSSVDAKFK
jgi:hypothetical protein